VGSVVGQDPLIGTWEAEPGRTMFGVAVIYTIKDLDNGLEVKSSSGST
jgi:hypothetical protein